MLLLPRAIPPMFPFRAVASAALALTLATGVSAETVRARYSVTLIGLPFGTATVTGNLAPQNYRIEMQAKLTGLASLVSSSKGAATATGVPNPAAPSKKAPNENAISNACRRWSAVRPPM